MHDCSVLDPIRACKPETDRVDKQIKANTPQKRNKPLFGKAVIGRDVDAQTNSVTTMANTPSTSALQRSRLKEPVEPDDRSS